MRVTAVGVVRTQFLGAVHGKSLPSVVRIYRCADPHLHTYTHWLDVCTVPLRQPFSVYTYLVRCAFSCSYTHPTPLPHWTFGWFVTTHHMPHPRLHRPTTHPVGYRTPFPPLPGYVCAFTRWFTRLRWLRLDCVPTARWFHRGSVLYTPHFTLHTTPHLCTRDVGLVWIYVLRWLRLDCPHFDFTFCHVFGWTLVHVCAVYVTHGCYYAFTFTDCYRSAFRSAAGVVPPTPFAVTGLHVTFTVTFSHVCGCGRVRAMAC